MHQPWHLLARAFGLINIIHHPMSTSGFLQPTTSPNCVRSLAARMEQEADEKEHPDAVVANSRSLDRSSLLSGSSVAHPSPEEVTVEFQLREARDSIFRLMVLVGEASALLLDEAEALGCANKKRTEQVLAQILITLMEGAIVMKVDLEKACHAKIELNLKKYPVELCKVSACGMWLSRNLIVLLTNREKLESTLTILFPLA
jgi:hypothetical protein